MERNTGTRRPKTNSPAKGKSLVSSVKAKTNASVQRVRKALGSLRRTVPPLRDIVTVVAITVGTFALGFFVGRGTRQSLLPGDFVSIQEVDIHGTSSRLADATEGLTRQDITTELPVEGEGATGNGKDTAATNEKDTTAMKEKDAAATKEQDAPLTPTLVADTGVVGPVPTKTPEVQLEAPRRETAAPTKENMIMPVQGRVVSGFGWRKHPVYQDWRYHTGVDIGVVEGSPVKAALSGKVVESDSARELGLYVVIEHPNGIKTKYAHLTSSSVNRGDQVKQGQIIGKAGASGVTSGPCLHFEVISGGKVADPEGFL